MARVPSLLSLCTRAIAEEIIYGDHNWEEIFELPSDLVDQLVVHLPAVALHKLHDGLSVNHDYGQISGSNNIKKSRKRGRFGDLNAAWETLFKLRWPQGVKCVSSNVSVSVGGDGPDWHQKYWEAHLQNCLDDAAETALLLSFEGCVADIAISETTLKLIGFNRGRGHTPCEYTKLSDHCQKFGGYARWLRLQNILCASETCRLLKDSRLQGLVFRSIKSKTHVDGACKLMDQNSETLLSLEFIHCKLTPAVLSRICHCLCSNNIKRCGIQYFCIKSSSILESTATSMPFGFITLLLERSLRTLTFCDTRMAPDFAKMIFNTLLGSSSDLSAFELSESNISGWLSTGNWRTLSCSSSTSRVCKSLKLLRVLNLRGDNLHKDDVEELISVIAQNLLPNLQSLDISDNPFGDDGLRSLVSYVAETSTKAFPLAELKLENCDLSCKGVAQLLETLSIFRPSLPVLSVASNGLGSDIAASLAKFLAGSSTKVLNIEGIGLAPTGFVSLGKEIPEEVKLVELNISKNRGGMETANFISKLVARAAKLVSIDAGYNLIPLESLEVISQALKLSTGKLERLDLTGNMGCYNPGHNSALPDLHINGKSIVILPSSPATAAPYDDDP